MKSVKNKPEIEAKAKTAWEKVCLARMADRPKTLDYINKIFTDFVELHGDRSFGDDKSIIEYCSGYSDWRTKRKKCKRKYG